MMANSALVDCTKQHRSKQRDSQHAKKLQSTKWNFLQQSDAHFIVIIKERMGEVEEGCVFSEKGEGFSQSVLWVDPTNGAFGNADC